MSWLKAKMVWGWSLASSELPLSSGLRAWLRSCGSAGPGQTVRTWPWCTVWRASRACSQVEQAIQVPSSPNVTVAISHPPHPPPQAQFSFSLEQHTCSAGLNSQSQTNVLQINIQGSRAVPVAGAELEQCLQAEFWSWQRTQDSLPPGAWEPRCCQGIRGCSGL